MEPFIRVTATALPMESANVDTDQVIPARFLGKKLPDLAAYAFYDLRFDAGGKPRADYVMNNPAYKGATILVARDNFGCGSSREHAVWALMNCKSENDFGFRVVISPSFGEIFYSNSCKNGLLAVVLSAPVVEKILEDLVRDPRAKMTVDLEKQVVVAPDGSEHRFEFDPFQRNCLLNGLDDIAITMKLEDKIVEFETKRAAESPWL